MDEDGMDSSHLETIMRGHLLCLKQKVNNIYKNLIILLHKNHTKNLVVKFTLTLLFDIIVEAHISLRSD